MLGGSLSILLALVVAVVGSGGVVFGALRYNREEAGKIVAQQSTILEDMQKLYESTKKERDELREEVGELRKKVDDLQVQIDELRTQQP